ncbi:hypothetical protein [Ancylobacter polymorphus]|uniref:ribonucleoside-diphosphate reductase n=1 Tax=Ancylobacter polymorphus TaxID=223390 RepID=A0A9E7CY06_9HYPH|nr:hypothetical protein [Ancylobacter polymorphus]UOK72999.1 hypothetical protein K9D25_10020 [Ancylobacter polymorphus]
MTRELLPVRRFAESMSFTLGNIFYVVTLGYYDDGRVGEVFVGGPKSGSDAETNARDAAAILSIAMQYGVPPAAFATAVHRDSEGVPLGPIGAVVDHLAAPAAPSSGEGA